MIAPRVWKAGLLALLIIARGRTQAGQKGRPLTEDDLVRLLAGGVYSQRVATLVLERGLAFSPTKRDLELLQNAGADRELQRTVLVAGENKPGRGQSETAQSQPLIIWHRVDGHWRWHCEAHCSKYRTHHAEP